MADIMDAGAVRAFYDHFGARQDAQGWYEDAALDLLVANGEFTSARFVVEFGCGTGRFARRLFEGAFGPHTRWSGLDISPRMVALARSRLAPFAGRAEVHLTDGTIRLPVPDAAVDRVIACYVLDLLGEGDIRAFLNEAHRTLAPGGLLCLAGLGRGRSLLGRIVAGHWSLVHRLSPRLVGGCRPVEIAPMLGPARWTITFRATVEPWKIPSEVLIARRRE